MVETKVKNVEREKGKITGEVDIVSYDLWHFRIEIDGEEYYGGQAEIGDQIDVSILPKIVREGQQLDIEWRLKAGERFIETIEIAMPICEYCGNNTYLRIKTGEGAEVKRFKAKTTTIIMWSSASEIEWKCEECGRHIYYEDEYVEPFYWEDEGESYEEDMGLNRFRKQLEERFGERLK